MSERSAPTAGRGRTEGLGTAGAAALLLALATACTSYYEVPIEVPIAAKLDVEKYNRILVAGFATQTNENIDLDAETVRLLRNQLRTRSTLQVLDAEIEPLGDFSDKTLEQSGMLEKFKEIEDKAKSEGEEQISRQEWIDLEQDKILEDEEFWKEISCLRSFETFSYALSA